MNLRVLVAGGKTGVYTCIEAPEDPVGFRVLVKTRSGGRTGVVVGFSEESPQGGIVSFPDKLPLLRRSQIELLYDLTHDYLLPSAGFLLEKLLPSAFLWEEETTVRLKRKATTGLDPISKRVIEYLLKVRRVEKETLKKKFSSEVVNLLLEKGFLEEITSWEIPNVERRFYRLKVPEEEALRRVRSETRRRLILFLSGRLWVSEEEIKEEGFKKSDLRDLIRRGIVEEESRYVGEIREVPLRQRTPIKPFLSDKTVLWTDYEEAINTLEAVAEAELEKGKSLLVLFPERDQLIRVEGYMRDIFGDRVVSIHALKKPKELIEGWFYASENPSILLGTHLALLCPAKDIGAVVLFDESSQGNKIRHIKNFDLRRAGYRLALKVGAKFVAITPAPTVASYYLVKKKGGLLRKSVKVRDVLLIKRKPSEILTQELKEEILERPDKTTLFLVPKHGYSYAYCDVCSDLVDCPQCGTLLSYSKQDGRLFCTNCRFRTKTALCPRCGNEVKPIGFGLEKAMEVVEKIFKLSEDFSFDTYPHWGRSWDRVVVLSADLLLSVPSYLSEEKLFLYLMRAYGCAREKLIIQTLFTDHPIFKAVEEGSFEDFLREELSRREKEGLPPFWRYVLVESRSEKPVPYIRKGVSPFVRVFQNMEKGLIEILIKFRGEETLKKLKEILKRFRRDIVSVAVDPF